MRKLKPYQPDTPCPKCGHADVRTSYCDGDKWPTAICYDAFRRLGEHLHRICQRCHFEWMERCVPAASRVGGEEAEG